MSQCWQEISSENNFEKGLLLAPSIPLVGMCPVYLPPHRLLPALPTNLGEDLVVSVVSLSVVNGWKRVFWN